MATHPEIVPFIDAHLDEMVAIAGELGDDLVIVTPPLPGANSPFAIVTHCVGVTDWWIGKHIAGRDVQRDRPKEFTATGTVDQLADAVTGVKQRFHDDLAAYDPGQPIADGERYPADDVARTWNHEAALIHTLDELAQHHGQLELTRDLLRAGGGR